MTASCESPRRPGAEVRRRRRDGRVRRPGAARGRRPARPPRGGRDAATPSAGRQRRAWSADRGVRSGGQHRRQQRARSSPATAGSIGDPRDRRRRQRGRPPRAGRRPRRGARSASQTCRAGSSTLSRAERVAPLHPQGQGGRWSPAWRLLDVEDLSESERVPPTSRLVGREPELALLEHAVERTSRVVTTAAATSLTVLGAAGVGKTRLLGRGRSPSLDPGATVLRRAVPVLRRGHRLLAVAADASARPPVSTTRSRPTPHGRSPAAAPVVHDDPEAQRIVERLAPLAGLQGTPRPGRRDRTGPCRRLLEALGRPGPAGARARRPPLGRAGAARPRRASRRVEPRHTAPARRAGPPGVPRRPAAVGRRQAERVDTAPRAAPRRRRRRADSTTCEGALPHGARLDAGTRARILQAAGGMPLYLEQMLATLADDGWPGPGRPGRAPSTWSTVPPSCRGSARRPARPAPRGASGPHWRPPRSWV